ncbi:MAG: helix-turn-helix domain-containing protein [Alphaproteobacteria bacterium]|nr:helix-turn-helix domain-containing protein [Alphaproteobacteria bacterium]
MTTKEKKTKGTPDSVDTHVGQRLRVRRSLLGLSQEKLAESIGLTFQQVQKYERGLNRISAGRLYNLSNILHVPVSYFFENLEPGSSKLTVASGFSDNEQEAFAGPDIMNDKKTIELVRAYHSIKDPKIQRDVLRLVKSMAESAQKSAEDA